MIRLCDYKSFCKNAAKDLGYPDEINERIEKAKNIEEVARIMTTYRLKEENDYEQKSKKKCRGL